MYLILYDAELREAYWIDTKEIALSEQSQGDRVRVRVPFENVLGVRTLFQMRQRKHALWQFFKGKDEESK